MNAPLTDQEGNEVVVKITLSTIYSTLLEVKQTLTPMPDKVEDHEARLRLLERRVWSAAGTSAIVSSILVALAIKFLVGGT